MRDERIKDELKILGSSIGKIAPIDKQMPPDGYFDVLTENVMQDIKFKEGQDNAMHKEYFEHLGDHILQQVAPAKTYRLPYILGIASSIALLLIALSYITVPTATQEYAFKTEFSDDELLYALEEYYTIEEIAFLEEDQDAVEIIDEESAVYLDYLEDYDLQESDIELD